MASPAAASAAVAAGPAAAAPSTSSAPEAPLAAGHGGPHAAAPATAAEPAPVLVPRCSEWFDLEAVNPIERRMLPEFFVAGGGAKTEALYLKYRNYMVQAYRQQPAVYLTATACRRNLAGDACAILRVHEFLTHWGLINFHVPPHAAPAAAHANYALRHVHAPTRRDSEAPLAVLVEQVQPANGGSSGDRLVNGAAAVERQCELCGRACRGEDDFFELSADAKRRSTTAASGEGGGHAAAAVSNGKPQSGNDGIALTVGAFAVRPGSGICERCFLSRAFPDGYDAGDFVRVAADPKVASTPWTSEERERLLEAVSSSSASNAPGEDQPAPAADDELRCDWNYVSAKVGSKTPEECLLHFLELPLLNESAVDRRGGSATSRVSEAVRSLHPMTPAGTLNAAVLDLSELVAQVDPLVAKAAARAAISAVQQLHSMTPVNATPASASTSPDAIKEEGVAATTSDGETSDAVTVGSAAQAVADSNAAAGVAIKSEVVDTDGDIVMESTETTATSEPSSGSSAAQTNDDVNGEKPASDQPNGAVKVTKETVAVVEEAASATTVALVAARAHAVAEDTANGPIRDLVDQLLENQLQQIELKLKQLSVLEATLAAERDELARERYDLYMDRLAFAQEKIEGKNPAQVS